MANPSPQELIAAIKSHMPRNTRVLIYIAVIAVVASWIPLALIAKARAVKSDRTRIHIFQDMDNQPRYKAQASVAGFGDMRAMRPRIEGTVARGELQDSDHLYRGFKTNADGLPIDAGGNLVDTKNDADHLKKIQWFDSYPEEVAVDKAFVKRGQEMFNVYCAVCHGLSGDGNGLVHQFITQKKNYALGAGEQYSPNWPQPQNLQLPLVRDQAVGQLYNTIVNGKGNMRGYKAQVDVEDRWAIVAYIKALHESQPVAETPGQ